MRVATIAPLAFYTIATLSSVGIALAIAFLAFNLHFRKLKWVANAILLSSASAGCLLCTFHLTSLLRRAIKLSSPKLSNITAVGCIFVYATVILLGLDHSTLPSAADSFATVCTVSTRVSSAREPLFEFRLCKQYANTASMWELATGFASSNMTFSFSAQLSRRSHVFVMRAAVH